MAESRRAKQNRLAVEADLEIGRAPFSFQRDPGDEDDHQHRFDDLTALCVCGASHEQLRRH